MTVHIHTYIYSQHLTIYHLKVISPCGRRVLYVINLLDVLKRVRLSLLINPHNNKQLAFVLMSSFSSFSFFLFFFFFGGGIECLRTLSFFSFFVAKLSFCGVA